MKGWFLAEAYLHWDSRHVKLLLTNLNIRRRGGEVVPSLLSQLNILVHNLVTIEGLMRPCSKELTEQSGLLLLVPNWGAVIMRAPSCLNRWKTRTSSGYTKIRWIPLNPLHISLTGQTRNPSTILARQFQWRTVINSSDISFKYNFRNLFVPHRNHAASLLRLPFILKTVYTSALLREMCKA